MERDMSSIRTLSDTMYILKSRAEDISVDATSCSSPVPLERTESAPILPSSPVDVNRGKSSSIPPSRALSPLTLTSSIKKTAKGSNKLKKVEKAKKVTFSLPVVAEDEEQMSQALEAPGVSVSVTEEALEDSTSSVDGQDHAEEDHDSERDHTVALGYCMPQYGDDSCPLDYCNEEGASLGY